MDRLSALKISLDQLEWYIAYATLIVLAIILVIQLIKHLRKK